MDSDSESDSTWLLAAKKSKLFRSFIAALFASEAICFILAVSVTLLAKNFGADGWAAIAAGLGVGYYADYCFEFFWPYFARWHYRQAGWQQCCWDSLKFFAADKPASWVIAVLETAVSTVLYPLLNSELAVVGITLLIQFPVYCVIFSWLSLKAMPCLIAVEL
jgi:hypothetical protein